MQSNHLQTFSPTQKLRQGEYKQQQPLTKLFKQQSSNMITNRPNYQYCSEQQLNSAKKPQPNQILFIQQSNVRNYFQFENMVGLRAKQKSQLSMNESLKSNNITKSGLTLSQTPQNFQELQGQGRHLSQISYADQDSQNVFKIRNLKDIYKQQGLNNTLTPEIPVFRQSKSQKNFKKLQDSKQKIQRTDVQNNLTMELGTGRRKTGFDEASTMVQPSEKESSQMNYEQELKLIHQRVANKLNLWREKEKVYISREKELLKQVTSLQQELMKYKGLY